MIIPNSRPYTIPFSKQSTENIFNEFLEKKLSALLEPELNEDIELIDKIENMSTVDESICKYSKVKQLNSSVFIVSSISDSDEKDYEAYKIKNRNDFEL